MALELESLVPTQQASQRPCKTCCRVDGALRELVGNFTPGTCDAQPCEVQLPAILEQSRCQSQRTVLASMEKCVEARGLERSQVFKDSFQLLPCIEYGHRILEVVFVQAGKACCLHRETFCGLI